MICFTFWRSLRTRRQPPVDGRGGDVHGRLRDDGLDLGEDLARRARRSRNSPSRSGMRPASMREMSRMSLMMPSRWRRVGVHPGEALRLLALERPQHALQEHARVAEDRVERRAELVGHVGEELRLERGGLLELDGLAAQQLVLAHQLGGGLAHLPLELAGGLLELVVEALALEGLGAIVQDGDDGGELACCSEKILPETASTGTRAPVSGSTRLTPPR